MSYCLAFSCDGAMDVSKGYIQSKKWPEALSLRNLIPETDLSKVFMIIQPVRETGDLTFTPRH